MAVQTERITILGSPDFKVWLEKESGKQGLSLSEFVRQRCLHKADEDELLLSTLVTEVKRATQKAKASLNKGLKDVENVLAEIRQVKK